MHDGYDSTTVIAPVPSGYSMSNQFVAYSSFLYSDRNALDYEKAKGQFYGLSREEEERMQKLEESAPERSMGTEVIHGRKLSDVQLAMRRAEEAASRRSQAAAWLQRIMGPLDLSSEPTEEELRQCLRNGLVLCNLLNRVQPGVQVKVVDTPSASDDNAHSAYQYFENLRNFIVALEELGLPTFEASDLEEVSYLPGSSAKVVDSVLALKAYHDWRLSGGSGLWKYGGSVKSPRLSSGRGFSGLSGNGVVKSPSLLSQTNMSRQSNQQRRRWDGPEDVDISSPDCVEGNGYKAGRVLAVTIPQANGTRPRSDLSLESEALMSPNNVSDSTSSWIQHIGFRIREVLQGKAKQEFASSDDKENSGSYNGYDDAPSQSLLSLVSAIIGDKHPEEVPMLVEFILRKVMEEFERRLHAQGEQVKKTKSALKEILAREERLTSRAKILEALAAGTGEEVKLVSNQLQHVKIREPLATQPMKDSNLPTQSIVNDSLKEYGSADQRLQKDFQAEFSLPTDDFTRCSWASYASPLSSPKVNESLESTAHSLGLCSQVKTPLFGWPQTRHLDDLNLSKGSPWLKSLSQEFLDLQKYLPLCPSKRCRTMEKRQIEEEKRAKEEDIDRLTRDREEKQLTVDVLKNELEMIKRADQEQKLQLQLQKREMELESKARLRHMENQLIESQRKAREVEASCASELRFLRQKVSHYEGTLWQQSETIKELRVASNKTRDEVTKLKQEWSQEVHNLGAEMLTVAKAASGYHKVLEENRQLYNEVQDLKGNIRVYCRVRPFLSSQVGRPSTVDFVGDSGDLIIVNPNKQGKDARKTFSFNKVFDVSASQEQVFLDTQPLIRSVLDGYNVCIFAYGQTGSGKTYTMSGPNSTTEESWGVNYRALNDLFGISQMRSDAMNYEVGVQMIEIYNEQVRDLLVSDGASKKLEIRNSSQQNGLNVPDASMLPVSSTADVLDLMKIGQKNRAVGATALNERSSRSHSVLTVHVQGTDLKSGAVLRGCLHLVDLAGSERVDKSEATGERLKEAQHINKSLSALGDVIFALAQKSAHVPYRNSKLTQLLQDSLGGQAKTLMFVHISPDMESYGETVSTLKFAERVATVELGAARSHKETGDIRDLKEQIATMRDLLAKKDVEIAKKDAEVERLAKEIKTQESRAHETRIHGPELASERLKPKVPSSAHIPRRMNASGEVQAHRPKKHGGEGVVFHAEAHQTEAALDRAPKQPASLVISVSQDGSSEEREAESPVDSPGAQKLSPEDGQRTQGRDSYSTQGRDSYSTQGRDSYSTQRRDTSTSTSPDSDPPAPLLDTHPHKKRSTWNLAGKHESGSRDWQERIQSSFLGSSSDDYVAASWREEFSGQGSVYGPTADLRARNAGQTESTLGNQGRSVVAGDEAESTGADKRGLEETVLKKDLYASVDALLSETLRNGMLERREAEGEERSDYSEGELSQCTDVSSVNPAESVVSAKQEDLNMKKPHQIGERRSQAQGQSRRPPPRAERKLAPSEPPNGRPRRHSMIGTAITSAPESKRGSLVGPRHGTDPHSWDDSGKSAGTRHPGSQPATKSSKRWL